MQAELIRVPLNYGQSLRGAMRNARQSLLVIITWIFIAIKRFDALRIESREERQRRECRRQADIPRFGGVLSRTPDFPHAWLCRQSCDRTPSARIVGSELVPLSAINDHSRPSFFFNNVLFFRPNLLLISH